MNVFADYGISERDAALLQTPRRKIIYIIGTIDTGKSTLAAGLARHLAAGGFRTALACLDAGQASVGLPATFAWAMCGRGGLRRTREMVFTGTTSPVGYMDESVDAADVIVRSARRAAEKVVVDTCGLATGRLGREFHAAMMRVVRPHIIVAIQRKNELAWLDELLAGATRPLLVRANVPGAARKRSTATRRRFRAAKFREYFASARPMTLRLDGIRLLRPGVHNEGRIVSLRDRAGRDIALGIIQKFRESAGTMTVFTPQQNPRRIRAVIFGSLRIARTGRQLARNV